MTQGKVYKTQAHKNSYLNSFQEKKWDLIQWLWKDINIVSKCKICNSPNH